MGGDARLVARVGPAVSYRTRTCSTTGTCDDESPLGMSANVTASRTAPAHVNPISFPGENASPDPALSAIPPRDNARGG